MATSDKLNYLIGTKNAIKEAIVEKGVDVSNSDTFRSYAEKIKSISAGGGGGGDKVYATNRTEVQPAGKVLIKKGQEGGQKFKGTDTTGINTNWVYPSTFIDNSTIITSLASKGTKKIQYIDDAWNNEVIDSASVSNNGLYTWACDNGVITNKYMGAISSNYKYHKIVKSNGYITTPGAYLGEYNGVHYCTHAYYSDIYVYDYNNNTIASSSFINGPDNAQGAFLVGDKMFLNSSGNKTRMYKLLDNGSYETLNNDGIVATAIYPIGVTGLDIGDYVFAINNFKNSYYTPDYSTVTYLNLYVINSNYTISPVSVEPLKWLETTDCRVSYDRRNDVLMVGTTTGVFAYQFDRGSKTFTEMSLNLGLPTVFMGTPYFAWMSPDKKKISVKQFFKGNNEGANTFDENLWIFELTEEGWAIIDDKTLNYQPQSTYTGMATGYINEDGKYEVRVLLDESDKELA